KAWRAQSPRHRRAFERERMFWQELQVLDGGLRATAARAPRRIGRRAFLAGGGAAVAASAAMVAMPRLLLWRDADYTTAIGEQAEIPLPDGSVASLNTDSAIAVDFTPQLRL